MTAWMLAGSAILAFTSFLVWLWRRRNVNRHELPRVYELRSLLPDPLPPTAYFQNFDKSLGEWPAKRKQFRDIESDLQGLEADSWQDLKREVAPLLVAKDAKRGWQPLFDILNHAKAYNYLKRAG